MLFQMQLTQFVELIGMTTIWLAAFVSECVALNKDLDRKRRLNNFYFYEIENIPIATLNHCTTSELYQDWVLRFRNWLRTTGYPKTIRRLFNSVYIIPFQYKYTIFYDTFNSTDLDWVFLISKIKKTTIRILHQSIKCRIYFSGRRFSESVIQRT